MWWRDTLYTLNPVIGLGIKRYFHLYDMLNFMRGGILKLYIVNPCFLWCVFSMYYFNEEQVCNEKKKIKFVKLWEIYNINREIIFFCINAEKENIQKSFLNTKQFKI